MENTQVKQPLNSMASKIAQIDELCKKAKILPVITIAREQDVLPLADALAAGGLNALEITLRSEFGLKAIRMLRDARLNCVSVPAPSSTATCSRPQKKRAHSSSSRLAAHRTCWRPVLRANCRCCRASAARRKS